MKNIVEVELHQHTKRDGIPFGSKHALDALHKNVSTRCSHNITILTKIIKSGTDDFFAMQQKYKKFLQEGVE